MLERMVAGEVPRKHHTALRSAIGELRYEHCLTRAGFEGPYTIAYHERRPHEQSVGQATHGFQLPSSADRNSLRRRHYQTLELAPGSGPPIDARVPLLFNADVVISVVRPAEPDPVYFSNG